MMSPVRPLPVPRRSAHGRRPIRRALLVTGLGLFLALSPSSLRSGVSDRTHQPQFKYAGGTEDVLFGCAGTLQINSSSLTYTCAQYSVDIPYSGIEIMQYRADVTRRVRKLKLKWHVYPPMGGGHINRYFTLVYRISGSTHVLVLEVPNDEMRPYLAEIDLKCGRRVDVQRHEDYE